MDVLLSDGSGLTSRQVATQAARAGHIVDVVAPSALATARFTRHVRHVHRVPAFGRDPDGWLEATLDVLRAGGHDALVATQEQVTLLAREADRVHELGTGLATPPFASLLRVQDKVAQAATLAELGLPHPATRAFDAGVYLKDAIGTASRGVYRATQPFVVQDAAVGPLAMVQAVFAHGALVAWHANLRERDGADGGAAAKRSIRVPEVEAHLVRLGDALAWHGALSLDAVLTPDGPSYIDINPRLVEPGNAWRAGVDLVAALLAVSMGELAAPMAPGRPDTRTHQLLLALLGAAQRGEGRRAIARELTAAARGRGAYAGSEEELTPVRGDPLAAVPVAAVAAATLVAPTAGRWFTRGAVDAYAVTPEAWQQIRGG